MRVDQGTAQASIARGGVFLAEEKDHISWDARKVQIFEDSPDLENVPAAATLKWRYSVFQRFQQVTHEETFLKLNVLTQNRVFFCTAGWDGVRFEIES